MIGPTIHILILINTVTPHGKSSSQQLEFSTTVIYTSPKVTSFDEIIDDDFKRFQSFSAKVK